MTRVAVSKIHDKPGNVVLKKVFSLTYELSRWSR